MKTNTKPNEKKNVYCFHFPLITNNYNNKKRLYCYHFVSYFQTFAHETVVKKKNKVIRMQLLL